MSGVNALSCARGSVVSAPTSVDALARDAGRTEAIDLETVSSVWALRTSWYEEGLYPRLDDWWWRRLDCFVADCDDPRILAIVERMRAQYRGEEPPFAIPPVVDAATDEIGIVELILTTERHAYDPDAWDHSNDLLVDVIRMERSRW